MLDSKVELTASRFLSVGAFFVTVFLLTTTNTDPVNVTKLFVLGGVSIASLVLFLKYGFDYSVKRFKPYLTSLGAITVFMTVSLITSPAPLEQNLYGVYGRNTGYITYLFLVFISLCAVLIQNSQSFKRILYSFLLAGIVNIIYCSWVLLFGDFIGWNNPYGTILGLFGNPDFISAFLGMFITAALALSASSNFRGGIRAALLSLSLIALYLIVKSHAIQGLVVAAGGVVVIVFFLVRNKFRSWAVASTYLALSAFLGLVAVLGTLQKGPFTFLYKRSVSLRGSYWHAGIEMGVNHPFTGVGLDSYGDWYRRTRPPAALIDMPGINTMSNVSHNVLIDFFAAGGFPLLVSYVAFVAIGLLSIIRFTIRNRVYDPVFVALAGAWLGYQAQSIISINQIGLTIWGWLFTGLLVAYEKLNKNQLASAPVRDPLRMRNKETVISPTMIAGVGVIVGLLAALPPLNADSKWFTAINSYDAAKVEQALTPSLFNPSDSRRYAEAVQLFQSSNLLPLAHKYALLGTEFNQDYFDAWKQLYFLPNSSESEKAIALINMKRLDPKNPDVTAVS